MLTVPSADLMTGMLELPPRAPGMPFDQIARLEFARVNKCEPAGFELACWDLPQPARAGKGTNLMAVGYAHSAGEKFLDLVESAGINAVGMESAACALVRACTPLCAPVG